MMAPTAMLATSHHFTPDGADGAVDGGGVVAVTLVVGVVEAALTVNVPVKEPMLTVFVPIVFVFGRVKMTF